MRAPHLFVDVSAHGLGHLAQVAPVLQVLRSRLPSLRLTIRSGLPRARLATRVPGDFTHLAESSDFGYVMHDATHLDLAATALAYRRQHADWQADVDRDARLLAHLQPDLVLTDVAYRPLAAAAQAGLPAQTMCSLNWADLFAHFFAGERWAAPIHRQMLAAYDAAECFYCLTPGMPMPEMARRSIVGPIAEIGRDCRQEVRTRLGCAPEERLVLVAFGGVNKELPVADWPPLAHVRWLVPQAWRMTSPRVVAFESLAKPLPDLLRAVDAVLTKPGYGTFCEAVCNATPVLYLRRPDWPEQTSLIDWLRHHGSSQEVGESELACGRLGPALTALWRQPLPRVPAATGADEIAAALLPRLTGSPSTRIESIRRR